MKRTFISLGTIVLLLIAVLAFDIIFTTYYSDGMLKRLDLLESVGTFENKMNAAEELIAFYEKNDIIAHRLIPTNRMDELESSIYRLVAFLEAGEDYEVSATVAEIRARIHSLYSTWFYRWYHPRDFGIE